MKTTKGGKVMNPTDAYRKELRKRELKRNKKERKKVREVGILKKDPEMIREQIEKLEMMRADGALDKARKHKKRQLEDTLSLVLKKRKEYEEKMKEKGETPVMFSHLGLPRRMTSTEEEDRVKQPKPEDSVYYHPTFNPTGAPPPGKPLMYKSSIGPRVPFSETLSGGGASITEADPTVVVQPSALPQSPPLLSGKMISADARALPASLSLSPPPPPPPPPFPPKSNEPKIGTLLPPSLSPPPPVPPPSDQHATRIALQQSAQPPPPGTILNGEKNLPGLSLDLVLVEKPQVTAVLPPPPPLKSNSNQLDGAASSESDLNTTLLSRDNPMVIPPHPSSLNSGVAGQTAIPPLHPDVLPPGISRFPPPPPPQPLNIRLPISIPRLLGQLAPPGVIIPLMPRPSYGSMGPPPPLMRPPPQSSLILQDDAVNKPPVLQKPSYVKSAAPTVVKRPLAQHTPELTAMVPASVQVRRETTAAKPKPKPTSSTLSTSSSPATPPQANPPMLKTQSIDDSYMAFLEDMKALGALDGSILDHVAWISSFMPRDFACLEIQVVLICLFGSELYMLFVNN